MADQMQDLFFEESDDDPSDENLDDLLVGEKSLAGAVLYNTDWTVETITGQVAKGSIDLTPSFQRRDAWTVAKKSLFIESILLNFPVPPLTLAERGNSKTYLVVDGKQRLTTLSQFFGLMPTSARNSFKLTGLKELPQLNGLDLGLLRDRYPSHINELENYTIRTNVIRGWQRDDVLYSIFLRLNSGSVKLSPQELRQALKPGPFSDWLIQYSEGSMALRSVFPGTEPDFRMRDLELLLRYFGFQFFIDDYRGDLKRFLDSTVDTLNRDWADAADAVKARAAIFEAAYRSVVTVFGERGALRKWNGDRWENRLNRAVFDVMVFYLRTPETIQAFEDNGEGLVLDYQALCSNSTAFREAVESTTKSIEAVATRLFLWGEILIARGVVSSSVHLTADRVIEYDSSH